MMHSSRALYIKSQFHGVICCSAILLFLTQIEQSNTVIVPNEFPSILSLVYANIPPIKKGSDSRLGFGFRLGEHADFQVLFELGPQKETRPIGKDNSDGTLFNKRQVNKKQQLRVQNYTTETSSSLLEKWSNALSSMTSKATHSRKQNAFNAFEMSTIPPLPDQTLMQLHMLYKMATTSNKESTHSSISTTESTPMAAKLGDTTS